MIMDFANASGLPWENDPRVSYLAMRSRSKLVPFFAELYHRIEEEFEPAYQVLKSLGMGTVSDFSLFYRFRKKCCRLGVWVGATEFSASSQVGFFEPAAIKHWRDLIEYSRSGMVPRFKAGAAESAVENTGLGAVYSWTVNRGRLGALALEKWLNQGFGPTAIFRFLAPFFKGLTWWQVYLQVQKIRRKIRGGRLRAVPASEDEDGVSGSVESPEDAASSGGDILVFPSESGNAGDGIGEITAIAPTVGGELVKVEANGLLDLFGDLPDGGRVDDFLSSPGAAKLRSAKFWQEVNQLAGASFSGRFEFGGMALQCQSDELGELPRWCQEFSLALTKALGFKEQCFRGAMGGHPSNYSSFNSWYLVMGHLLETVWMDRSRFGELDKYFRENRIQLRMPKGGQVEIATLEESFYRYLVLVAPFGLRNASPVNIINVLAIEWVKWSKLLFQFGIPWRSEVDYELYLHYARTVFSVEPGVAGAKDLEIAIKRTLFKAGTF
jgi:hypothetical protein